MNGYGSRRCAATLRRVLVRPPQPADAARWREYGWRAAPDPGRAAARSTRSCARSSRTRARRSSSAEGEPGNPDAIYVYDPLLVGEAGAVLLRPGKEGRLGSRPRSSADLETAGVPVAAGSSAPACVEGGDTVWLDERTLLVGLGLPDERLPASRRSAQAFPGVEVITYDLAHWNGRGEVLHLMSFISPLDRDLALVYPRLVPVRLLELLADRGVATSRSPTRSSRRWAPTSSRSGRAARSRSRGTTRRGGGMERAGVDVRRLPRRRDLAQGRRRPDLSDTPALCAQDADVFGRSCRRVTSGDEARTAPRSAGSARTRRPRAAAARRESAARRLRGAAVGRTRGCEELLDADTKLVALWSADGFTPLHLAAYFGHVDGVRLLLERGADVDAVARNALAVQPLNSAAASRELDARVEVARLLLDAGADPNGELPRAASARSTRRMQNGDEELVALLRERGGLSASARLERELAEVGEARHADADEPQRVRAGRAGRGRAARRRARRSWRRRRSPPASVVERERIEKSA